MGLKIYHGSRKKSLRHWFPLKSRNPSANAYFLAIINTVYSHQSDILVILRHLSRCLRHRLSHLIELKIVTRFSGESRMPIGNISAKTSERRIAHARDRRDAFQVLRCIASLVSCRCIISLPLTRDAIPLEAIIPRNYFSMMNRVRWRSGSRHCCVWTVSIVFQKRWTMRFFKIRYNNRFCRRRKHIKLFGKHRIVILRKKRIYKIKLQLLHDVL